MEGRNSVKLEMLYGKIHRATITQADLNYVGSITIDEALIEDGTTGDVYPTNVTSKKFNAIKQLTTNIPKKAFKTST